MRYYEVKIHTPYKKHINVKLHTELNGKDGPVLDYKIKRKHLHKVIKVLDDDFSKTKDTLDRYAMPYKECSTTISLFARVNGAEAIKCGGRVIARPTPDESASYNVDGNLYKRFLNLEKIYMPDFINVYLTDTEFNTYVTTKELPKYCRTKVSNDSILIDTAFTITKKGVISRLDKTLPSHLKSLGVAKQFANKHNLLMLDFRCPHLINDKVNIEVSKFLDFAIAEIKNRDIVDKMAIIITDVFKAVVKLKGDK